MNNRFPSRTSLFLIELMISIFFFIIATTIVLQLFVKSYQVSQKTIYTNDAYQCAQNLAELFLGSNGDYHYMQEQFSTYDYSNIIKDLPSSLQPLHNSEENACSRLLLLYNKNWNLCTSIDDADFFIHVLFSNNNTFAYENIYITTDIPFLTNSNTSEPFYELTVQKYIPQYTDIPETIGGRYEKK